jgi:hypothetical protein
MALATRPWISRVRWVLLALLCMELILRWSVRYSDSTYSYDAEWGSRKMPGSIVRWGTEGYGLTRYSAPGEIETPYSGGTTVVILGDSHTESFQVGSENNFVSIAERQLREQGIFADLRNMGESGLDLVDYVYRIPLIRKVFNPKVLVIQLATGDFEQESARSENLFVETGADHPVVRHNPPRNLNTTAWRIKESVSLLDYGSQRFKELFLRRGNAEAAIPPSPEEDGKWRERLTRQLLALKAVIGDLPTVILPLPYEPLLSKKRIERTSPRYQILLEELRRIETWNVIDPSGDFNKLIDQGQFPRGFMNSSSPGSGHLNAAGHARVGLLLSHRLTGLLQ